MNTLKLSLFLVLIGVFFTSTTPYYSNYAMTAKLNGNYYEMNNMFGFNEATQPDISFYLSDDFIELRGRKQTLDGTFEIYLWIAKSELKEGTYTLNANTMIYNKTHAGLAYRSNNTEIQGVYRKTVSGRITITHLNRQSKTIKGNFEFKTNPDQANTGIPNFEITDGTFDYVYDVMDNSLDL